MSIWRATVAATMVAAIASSAAPTAAFAKKKYHGHHHHHGYKHKHKHRNYGAAAAAAAIVIGTAAYYDCKKWKSRYKRTGNPYYLDRYYACKY
jgi:uncharacterized membrane protein